MRASEWQDPKRCGGLTCALEHRPSSSHGTSRPTAEARGCSNSAHWPRCAATHSLHRYCTLSNVITLLADLLGKAQLTTPAGRARIDLSNLWCLAAAHNCPHLPLVLGVATAPSSFTHLLRPVQSRPVVRYRPGWIEEELPAAAAEGPPGSVQRARGEGSLGKELEWEG